MYRFSFSRMSKLSEGTKDRLRELTFGRENESPLYRWTFHSQAWACLVTVPSPHPLRSALPSHEQLSQHAVGWSCLTLQDDYLPVAGVYVEKRYRGLGLADLCSRFLLAQLVGPKHLAPGSAVQAVSELWPKWPAVIESAGLTFVEWA